MLGKLYFKYKLISKNKQKKKGVTILQKLEYTTYITYEKFIEKKNQLEELS